MRDAYCCNPDANTRRHALTFSALAQLVIVMSTAPAYAAASGTATSTITGELVGILLLSVPLAFVTSVIALGLYLRAVKRSMLRRTTPRGPTTAPIPLASVPPANALRLVSLTGTEALSDDAERFVAGATHNLWRLAGVYAAGGVAFALVMTIAYLAANGIGFLPFRTLFLFVSYAWPIVLTTGLIACVSRREWLAIVVAYIAIFAAVTAPSLNAQFTPLVALVTWAINNGPATVLVLTFLARPIRAVGPMMMAMMYAAVTGISLAVHTIGATDERMAWAAGVGSAAGLDGHQTFLAVMLTGFVMLGVGGWFLMRDIGRRYQAQQISDQSLMLDSLWLMFAINHGIDLVFAGPAWFAAALTAFAAYKVVTLALFAVFHRDDDVAPVRLLLLRVFSLGKRSERLFSAFSKPWRQAGTMRLIAGPDLATSTIEPHEFLGFLTGQIDRHFIDSPATLERRIGETVPHRDRDGRYRIGDFFCHDDTWKPVLRKLAASSDAIMMDLRGFSQKHKGCAFEIQELINHVPLGRIVLIADRTTDKTFLRETLERSWQMLGPGSPNYADPEPCVRIVPLASDVDTRTLLRVVAAAAHATPVKPVTTP